MITDADGTETETVQDEQSHTVSDDTENCLSPKEVIVCVLWFDGDVSVCRSVMSLIL